MYIYYNNYWLLSSIYVRNITVKKFMFILFIIIIILYRINDTASKIHTVAANIGTELDQLNIRKYFASNILYRMMNIQKNCSTM